MAGDCQVDFYVLSASAPSAGHLACRLCLKAWEEGHLVSVLAASEEDARRLDQLMWEFPAGRFLPHAQGSAERDVPVTILASPQALPEDRDVIVYLTADPIPQPLRFRRLLEIVPADTALRAASRTKYREYQRLGLNPNHHEMQTF